MKILPEFQDVKKIAATGLYNIVPVSTEILSDVRTPIETMKVLKSISTHCYMLESVAENEKWGRYTFLGFDPKTSVTVNDGKMRIGDVSIETNDPNRYLRQILSEYKSPKLSYLPPFTGGLVGYFSYDYIYYSEPKAKVDTVDEEGFKDIDLMLFDKVIAFDNYAQKIIIIANMSLDDLEVGYNKAILEIKRIADLIVNGKADGEHKGRLLDEPKPLFEKERFMEMVESGKHSIHEGDILPIVLSNRLSAPFAGSLLDTYRYLRTINPSP
ncbi:MAG: anthranilate synthase component I, partial [Clostridiales bacterium]|nr:anthranilate synthase component I [Clostridiales bacterium]